MNCIYCSQTINQHKITVKKYIKNKKITLKNATVYYCKSCHETFLSIETIEAFNRIKKQDDKNIKLVYFFDELMENNNKIMISKNLVYSYRNNT